MSAYKDYNDVNLYSEEKEVQSKLNSAGLINANIEKLWMNCYSYKIKGDLFHLNLTLDSIWEILAGDEKENGDNEQRINEINNSIYDTGSLNHKTVGFEKIKDNEIKNINLQYLLLNQKSIFLRRLQNSQGKGTAYKNSDDDDID